MVNDLQRGLSVSSALVYLRRPILVARCWLRERWQVLCEHAHGYEAENAAARECLTWADRILVFHFSIRRLR